MAYTINRTDGTLFATVNPGTIDNTTSLVMIGQNFEGYGEALNENFVRLLENHANNTAPANPQTGQLWYDTTSGKNTLSVYGSTGFANIGISTVGDAPATPLNGQLWYDTTNSQLKVFNGTTPVLVGPLIQPADYVGAGLKGVRLNATEDALEFTGFVNKDGDDMFGPLTLNKAGATPTDGAKLHFYDDSWNSTLQPRHTIASSFTTGMQFIGYDTLGTVISDVSIRGGSIHGLTSTPILDTDAANVLYVDTTTVALDGSRTMTGDLDMGLSQIVNVADPTLDTDAATRGFVDTTTVALDGTRTMTGRLNIDEFSPDKLRLRSTAGSITERIAFINQDNYYSGAVEVGFTRISLLCFDAVGVNTGTLTLRDGNVDVSAAAPTLPSHLTRMDYVEALVQAGSGSTGALVTNSVNTPVGTNFATTLYWDTEDYDDAGIHDTVANTQNLVVPAGVTKVKMTAQIDFLGTTAGAFDGYYSATMLKNGASAYPGRPSSDSGVYDQGVLAEAPTLNLFSAVLRVVAGDTFKISVYQLSGVSQDVNRLGSWFSMEIVE